MKNIDLLLAKYWECETSLEDELQLHEYFTSGHVAPEHMEYCALFQSFADAQTMTCNVDVEAIFRAEAAKEATKNVKTQEKTKVFSLKRYIPAVAVSLIGLLGLFTLYNRGVFSNDAEISNKRYVVLENEEDKEEAIKVTREALELLGVNYKKGTEVLLNMKDLEKTNIIK